jgi:hypothetical protein
VDEHDEAKKPSGAAEDTDDNCEAATENESGGAEAGDADVKKGAKVPLNVHKENPHRIRSLSMVTVKPLQPKKIFFLAEESQPMDGVV